MTQEQAEVIAYNWHYDGEYSFYDMEADREDLAKFIDPEVRGNSKFSVIKNDELIGFFSLNQVADKTIDIGLGMRPDLTGRSKGFGFLKAGIEFVRNEYQPELITLSVAAFNKRAIKVYRKIGFEEIDTYQQETNGSKYEFLKMVYEY